MLFSEFKAHVADHIIETNISDDFRIFDITVDSREVRSGFAFFALKGTKTDGHRFIPQVERKNPSLIVGEEPSDARFYIRVDSVREVLSKISPLFYGEPQKELSLIGITGTNGKTTVSYMVEHLLQSKAKPGVIGTVEYRWNGRSLKAPNTTPFPWSWYKLIRTMRSDGVDTLVSEVSSHALSQERIRGTEFDVAVFTNLSRDHLDFHGDLESYFEAKKLLFTRYLKSGGIAVVNVDDPAGVKLSEELKDRRIRTFSAEGKEADLSLVSLKMGSVGMDYVIRCGKKELSGHLPLVGRFNVQNMMAAILAVSDIVKPEEAVSILAGGVSVPGRMERVGSEGRVFIDYAHTPDALENILVSLSEIKGAGRIITVFGAGGDRDRGKRSQMGTVAERYSDCVILTNDNPRTESPENIVEDIKTGMTREPSVFLDRAEAVERALEIAENEDIVVVAGKGHEDYQIFSDRTVYFSDRETILKCMEARHAVTSGI